VTKKRAGVPRLPHLLGIEGLSPETISGLLDLSES
jgi:aspartate carbamoyltransferase catalytic subunit